MKMRLAIALSLLAAACGGGDDADVPDAVVQEPDAFVPDADPRGPVTIGVEANGQGVPGIDIVFNDVDGSVISSLQTGTDGTATENVLAGSSATILISPDTDQYATITYLAVEPGDNLTFVFEGGNPTDVGDLQVTLPGIAAGATSYEISLGCGVVLTTATPAVPVTGTINSDCLGSDNNIDVWVVALDAGNNPVAYEHAKDVAVVAAGTTNVTLDAWQDVTDQLDVTLTNVPAGITGAGLEPHWRVDGLDFGGFGGGGAASGGTIHALSSLPQGGFVDRLQYGLFMQLGNAFHGLLVAHANVPTTPAHNLATLLLPTMTAASAADASSHLEVSYTADGSFDSADGAIVLASWTDGAAGIESHAAYILVPPDAGTTFTLPDLPDPLSAFRTSADATFDVPSLIWLEADFTDGYRGWRRGPAFDLVGGNTFDMLPATGGVIRLSINQVPGG